MTDIDIASQRRDCKVIPRLLGLGIIVVWDECEEEINGRLVRENDGVGKDKVLKLERMVRPVNLLVLFLYLHHGLNDHRNAGSERKCHNTVDLSRISLVSCLMCTLHLPDGQPAKAHLLSTPCSSMLEPKDSLLCSEIPESHVVATS